MSEGSAASPAGLLGAAVDALRARITSDGLRVKASDRGRTAEEDGDGAPAVSSTGGPVLRLAIILGSGLAGVGATIEGYGSVGFDSVPGLAGALPRGHAGRVSWGVIEGIGCIAFGGRRHVYDGGGVEAAALPGRIAAALGVEVLVVTNAAGAINRTLRSGDIMILDDHINLLWQNPLIGSVRRGEQRFPDMSAPYDPALQALAERAATENGVRAQRGVYAAVSGPSYETRAEIRMLARMGADAVGMSTVPEVLVARAAGVRVVGLSVISNAAAGLGAEPLAHDDVLRASEAAEQGLALLIRAAAAAL